MAKRKPTNSAADNDGSAKKKYPYLETPNFKITKDGMFEKTKVKNYNDKTNKTEEEWI